VQISRTVNGLSLLFEEVLQSSSSVDGPWEDVLDASNPLEIRAPKGQLFWFFDKNSGIEVKGQS
jgi:hypothetical protein